jgi:hypothetical protein
MGRETSSENSKTKEADFHGAAILNEDGTETPITEDMVRDACEKLDSEKPDASAPD